MAIASGVYAGPPADKAGVRYVLALSFQSRGSAGPVEDAAGEAYARWFAEATEEGNLLRDRPGHLGGGRYKFPLLTEWDGMPTSDGWEVAVKAFSEMRQFEALKAWVRKPDGPFPGLGHFLHLRSDVLDLVAGSLDGPEVVRDALLSGVVGPDWKPAWQRYAPAPGTAPTRMAVVGQLLGMLSPLDPAAVARVFSEKSFDLPAGLHSGVKSRLFTALDAASGKPALSAWEGCSGGRSRTSRLVRGLGRGERQQAPLAGRSVSGSSMARSTPPRPGTRSASPGGRRPCKRSCNDSGRRSRTSRNYSSA